LLEQDHEIKQHTILNGYHQERIMRGRKDLRRADGPIINLGLRKAKAIMRAKLPTA
jgi:hypothetical protein